MISIMAVVKANNRFVKLLADAFPPGLKKEAGSQHA